MLGPFTFTFTLESEEFEKSEKVAAGYVPNRPWSTLELLTELTKEWNWTSWIVKLLLLHFIINTKGFHKKFCISWKAKIYWKLKSYLFIRETILCRQRLEQTFGAVLNIKQNNTYCRDNIKETEELKSRENEHRGVTLFWLAAIITGLGVILFR